MQKIDFRLNAIVDSSLQGNLSHMARIAALNGATIIQYRDKQNSTRMMIEIATSIIKAISETNIPLVINDRIDVALAVGAHGVHLGENDPEPNIARRILGPTAIIGRTVKNDLDAQIAIESPINYACIGGIFETTSKYNPNPPIGVDGFKKLYTKIKKARPDLPIGAISGINKQRAPLLIQAGADGIAIISAIFSTSDIAISTRSFREIIDTTLERKNHDC
ncbi:Thiamin-phosphate pyrophosphorylase [Liberibacter crescens BT-1]|uniref:Thiamine-phosphate synthase n=1 Tax=Liberibacter crescens (strain BT-1) TaxID=1215343 RepID=L0ERH5_LIBCB|nr:thiamine phosphate synthase [Liberibacter crescens]AGA64079.1 Thiamin-phosphate pyrophosphorylase [Liberibacter crescens BT-1]AMC12368.1 thiamine-phosphate pyrophosphorylase [Liberibacter crescens]